MCEQVILTVYFALFLSYGYLFLTLYPYKVQSAPLILLIQVDMVK